ncbi:MAG: DUF4336 domain-containing protein [Thermodesulfobacteriota bacterium]
MKWQVHKVDEDIWTVESVQKFAGVDFGGRMSVIRLNSGELFLHSPVKLNDQLTSDLNEIGEVKYVIAPNKFHHLHVVDYVDKYPNAQVWGAKGLAKKRKDIRFTAEFDEQDSLNLGDEILYEVFKGIPMFNEVVFYHPKSKTVLFTDIVFNVASTNSLSEKFYAWAEGVYKNPSVPRLVRLLIRDRKKARESADKILSWDFDRVSVTHRHIIETGGKEIVRRAFEKI